VKSFFFSNFFGKKGEGGFWFRIGRSIADSIGLSKIAREFRLKVFFLATTFMSLTACGAIWRPLKIAIFSKIVGADHIPEAKLYSLLFLIPMIILYSWLVDTVRRHHLLYAFTLFQAIGGIIFYFLLSHPVYGVYNTQASYDRILGWIFYFFIEILMAFLSTVFWAFSDSVSKPKDAKNYYGLLVSGSKMGGIIAAGSLYAVISLSDYFSFFSDDASILTTYMLVGSGFMFAAALSVYCLMRFVPGYYMHGYEAVYKLEKRQSKVEGGVASRKSFKSLVLSALEGFFIILKNSYVFGIFMIISFYEIMVVMLDFKVVKAADARCVSAVKMAAYYALYYLLMHSSGLLISLFGTTRILRRLGIKKSLLLFPTICALIVVTIFFFPTETVMFYALVLLRSMNYAINHPSREILYIPTVKSIKFKAKAWSDAFGSRIAKSVGSFFNLYLKQVPAATGHFLSSLFNFVMIAFWLGISVFLGKKAPDAIESKEVIGR